MRIHMRARVFAMVGFAVIGASAAAHAQAYDVRRATDEFTKVSYADLTVYTTAPLRKAELECTHTRSRAVMASLGIRRMVGTARDTTVALFAYYGGSDWLFIGESRSLFILANDSARAFSGVAPASRDVVRGGAVSEMQIYVINDDDIQWLAAAQQARVRLDGDRGRCDFTIPAGAWNLLRLFVQREIRGDSAAAP